MYLEIVIPFVIAYEATLISCEGASVRIPAKFAQLLEERVLQWNFRLTLPCLPLFMMKLCGRRSYCCQPQDCSGLPTHGQLHL